MAKTATKKFTHMVGSTYVDYAETNECAILFTSLVDALKFVKEQLKCDMDYCDDEETYFIAEIVSSTKVARSIVTTDHTK